MSDTPETDANCWREGASEWAAANFARKLERERDEARALFLTAMQLAETYKTERDEARQLLKAATEALNAIHVEVGGWIKALMDGGKQ